jgi:hypothetical protein
VAQVCGQTAYSRGGIHPQCAAQRADAALRKAAIKSQSAIKPSPRQQWMKRCLRCNRQVPARRVTCDCGHNFQQAVKQ